MQDISVWTVAGLALLTAVATGLGAVPFAFKERIAGRLLGLANALAAGLMTAASLLLLWEGGRDAVLLVLIGTVAGGLFVALTQRILEQREDLHVGALTGADAMKALLIVGVMTLHSVTEGVGVGVSFGGGRDLGVFITLAIAVHNVPEGLAIALVLVPRGVSWVQAAGWAVVSSLPQPLLAVPAFLAVAAFRPLVPLGMGFAVGAMLWVAARELLPEALDHASRRDVAGAALLGLAAMLAFQWLIG